MYDPNPIYNSLEDVKLKTPGLYSGFGGYEAELLTQHCRPGTVALDIGANFGYLSLMMANAVGALGWVYAFEPDKTNYDVLEANTKLREAKNIMPLPFAVGAKKGSVQLFPSDRGDTGDSRTYLPQDVQKLRGSPFESRFGHAPEECRSWHQHERQSYAVAMISLDDYFLNQEPEISMIKIDVQGYEPMVLIGMERLYNHQSASLFMEFDPKLLNDAGHDPYEFLQWLGERYQILDITSAGGDHTEEIINTSKARELLMQNLMHPQTGRFTNLLCHHK